MSDYKPNGEPRPCIIDDFVIAYMPDAERLKRKLPWGVVASTGTQYGRKGSQTGRELETHIRDLQRIVDYAKAALDAPSRDEGL